MKEGFSSNRATPFLEEELEQVLLTKIRRRIEDRLRKDSKAILMVARLLGIKTTG